MSEPIQILLVEDDIEDAMIFRSAASDINRNWNITHVEDGEKCIRYLEGANRAPDFILMDINMPRINGISCLKHIRYARLSPSTTIYMLSTSANETDINTAFDYGADLYLCKPHSYRELIQLLSTCIDINFARHWQRHFDNFLILDSKQLRR